MARKRDRIFAGFGALLFLITSSALAIGVIIVLVQQHKKPSDGATSTPASSAVSKSPVSATKLQGTKLENFTPINSVPQLQATDITPGTGEVVKPGATITFDYTGALAKTGVIFQSSKDTGQPITYSLSQLIPGWQQGIPGMKVGGTRRLLIPAAQGYGSNAQSGIPANSDLVFDITIHAIK